MKFLLVFSICSLAIAGVVWACADYDDTPFSIFSPEAFVSKQYTPFFYDSYNWYYGTRVDVEDNNNRFNAQVVSEWDSYLNHQVNQPALAYLLLKSGRAGIDSVSNYLNGKISTLKPGVPHISTGTLNKNQIDNFFSYLKLAKECEKFAVSEDVGWYSDPKPRPPVSPILENSLLAALGKSKDAFIKERLWFQLTRFYFFNDDTVSDKKKPLNKQASILALFDKYKSAFPPNVTYYRALGYVAGYYRRRGDYAQANYLYSRCYDYSFEMKIPSKFSFHAQQEDDWQATLKLAKNKQEQITLWHMLGMEYDPVRAIKEIAALDPKSDKMDLLLSRVINMREDGGFLNPYSSSQTDTTKGNLIALEEIKLVDSIAMKNNTAKPYYWNIAAGYLNYIHNDYKKAGVFYAAAKKQLPVNDKLITAQYKLLNILLDLSRIKRIDAKTEAKLVEPLNWLADLRDGKEKVTDLRFDMAVMQCTHFIGSIYKKQGDILKATCFDDTIGSYADSLQVQKLVNLFNNPKKSVYENTMLRYYHHTLPDLYYHQATLLTYKENIDKAIELMGKAKGLDTTVLLGNPFNIRINDCHDCDHEAPQKQKFTSLSFLKTIQSAKAELKAGKNAYINAWLLANAYYNISFYGNARLFYQSEIIGHNDVDPGSSKYPFMEITTSQKVAEKYYLLACANAQSNEQRARCTFMASKCERNEYYNQLYGKDASGYNYDPLSPPPGGKYFAELKNKYKQTKYYQEVLHECDYFKRYVNSEN